MNSIKCIKIRAIVIILISSICFSQGQNEIICVGFWNLENLFDTENDSLVIDEDRTPEGKYHWTQHRYERKLKNLSSVIAHMNPYAIGPDVLGICEVENLKVIQDLIHQKELLNAHYEIIHYDSPDHRGIDTALLYKPSELIISHTQSRRLLIYSDENQRIYTRDQLVVEAYIKNEKIYFIVNHWPSRSRGEEITKPLRIEAAKLNLMIIDSIRKQTPNAKIIAMGDYNDNPTSDSFKKTLQTTKSYKLNSRTKLYNPMENLFQRGIGTIAYRDQWHLFDQFYMTYSLLENSELSYIKAYIFKFPQLMETKGFYKGYPKRTYSGTNYIGGYADHFPIVLFLRHKKGSQ